MNTFEFYETPQAFSQYLFRTVPIAGRLFEPFVGTGAILTAYGHPHGASVWVTNDLDARHEAHLHLDATTRECWEAATHGGREPIDWTVTNPAFSCATEAIALAMEYSRIGVAMHLRASIHEVLRGRGKKRQSERRTFMREFTPTGILWLPRFGYQRSGTTGKWATDSVCACWVVWLKNPSAPQFIDYAPEWVADALLEETPAYRERMDRVTREWAAAVPDAAPASMEAAQ